MFESAGGRLGAPCFGFLKRGAFRPRFVLSSMPKKLKRYYGLGHLHFITFSCYRRMALLGTVRSRNAFVRALDEVRTKYQLALVGYVVMPEHVHLLIGEPKKGDPSVVVQSLKLRVSKRMRHPRAQNIRFTEIVRISPIRHALLAASVLRFQRMEREEAARKAGLHASKPGNAGVGD
jgi:REP element-mobilizing transposase RayT